MNIIHLTPGDLSLAAILILAVAALAWRMHLLLAGQILTGVVRTTVQLLLVGLVLRSLFAHPRLSWITLLSFAMLLAAGREVAARQRRRFRGAWTHAIGTASLFVSSFAVTLLCLLVIINAEPWYTPQYAVPLLGMLLGNTMTGIALALDRLVQTAWDRKAVIEQRLALGASRTEAIDDIRRDSIRAGLIPILNAMAAAGIVSLPGMMTGQILAGSPPVVAVQYQILIMFLIAAGTGFGTILAVTCGAHRLFDERHRLRLDRIEPSRS